MINVLLVLGYLIVAYVVAKLGLKAQIAMLANNQKRSFDKDEAKGNWAAIGLAWGFTVPFGLMFLVVGIMIYIIMETGKKIL